MKIGYIVKPNTKGQIVIPKHVRDNLGIDSGSLLHLVVRGDGMYIHTIKHIVPKITKVDSYRKILEKTQGTWAGDSWPQTEKRQRTIELAATRERKKPW